jgi:hypothetical protein
MWELVLEMFERPGAGHHRVRRQIDKQADRQEI